MIYKITAQQFTDITAAIPEQHSFGYQDENGDYLFNDMVLGFYDFDLDAVLTSLYGQTTAEFLGTLEAQELNNLKIWRFIEDDTTDLKSKDYTLLGLVKASPQFLKGAKTKSEYYADQDQTDLVVDKTFTDVFDPVETTRMVGIDICHRWYTESGIIGLEKHDYKPLSIQEVYELESKRRSRALDYLIGNARTTPLGAVIDGIVDRYLPEIQSYLKTGSTAFADAITNETEEPWVSYLNFVDNDGEETLFPDGFTVRQIILFQI